jgi:hypothetical protein
MLFEIFSFTPNSINQQEAIISPSKVIVKKNITKTGKEKRKRQFTKLYNKSIPLFSPLDNDDLLPLITERLG